MAAMDNWQSAAIWGSEQQVRLLRRFLALQIMFALGGALIVAYFLWGRDEEEQETSKAADEYVRGGQVAW